MDDIAAARQARDAERWRFWERYMVVQRMAPNDPTCWIAIPEICYRSRTVDPGELTDEMRERLPAPKTTG